MTFHDAWVGERVEDGHAFDEWAGGGVGTVPARCSPLFPDGLTAWQVIFERIKAGRYRGRCVDLDAFACVIGKDELATLVGELYELHRVHGGDDEVVERRWRELLAYVAGLAPGSYVLVACAT